MKAFTSLLWLLTLMAPFRVSCRTGSTKQAIGDDPLPVRDFHRHLQIEKDTRWKSRVGDVVQIPYRINDAYFNAQQKTEISNYIKTLSVANKVVNLVERTTQTNFIDIVNKSGSCSSQIGETGFIQEMNLNPNGCISESTVHHEFLHAMGLWHEQSRTDRDQYVTIDLTNVPEKNRHNFDIASSSVTLGTPYQYKSVMHYQKGAFAIDRTKPVVISKQPGVTFGGDIRPYKATEEDLTRIRLLYQCKSGARTLSEYNASPCNSDCKCWEGAVGCNGNSDACQVTTDPQPCRRTLEQDVPLFCCSVFQVCLYYLTICIVFHIIFHK